MEEQILGLHCKIEIWFYSSGVGSPLRRFRYLVRSSRVRCLLLSVSDDADEALRRRAGEA